MRLIRIFLKLPALPFGIIMVIWALYQIYKNTNEGEFWLFMETGNFGEHSELIKELEKFKPITWAFATIGWFYIIKWYIL